MISPDTPGLTPAQEARYQMLAGHVPKPGNRGEIPPIPPPPLQPNPIPPEQAPPNPPPNIPLPLDPRNHHDKRPEVELDHRGEAWLTEHPEVGTRVAEKYKGKLFAGTIDRVLLEHTDHVGDYIPMVYHVRYDDDDEAEIYGIEELERGKGLLQYMEGERPVVVANGGREVPLRRSARQQQVRGNITRLTPTQLHAMMVGEIVVPGVEEEPLAMWMQDASEEFEFCCLPTAAYNSAGEWYADLTATNGHHDPNPVVPQPLAPFQPTHSNLPPSALSMSMVVIVDAKYSKNTTVTATALGYDEGLRDTTDQHSPELSYFTKAHQDIRALSVVFNRPDVHWLHQVNQKGIGIMVARGYEEYMDYLSAQPTALSIPVIHTTSGLGYHPMGRYLSAFDRHSLISRLTLTQLLIRMRKGPKSWSH